ncbi:MAG: dihydrofolate reductase [Minisyncoccia bacterium]
MTAKISIVVALGRDKQHNHVIGKDNALLWHIRDDLKRFKALTLGHPVIMGRKTFESIVAAIGEPLPDRTNIVVTRDASWSYPEVVAIHSLAEALEKASSLDGEEIFIGGGTQLYTEALPFADRLYLTLIDDEKEGDAFFPPYEQAFTKEVAREDRVSPEGIKYSWVDLERP